MKIVFKLFQPGSSEPDFVGELRPVDKGTPFPVEQVASRDMELLWHVEQAINTHVAGRCHLSVEEES